MKKIILAAMAALTLAGSVPAHASIDYQGESYNNAWDFFWLQPGAAFGIAGNALATNLDPANSGWNDFWNRCNDPSKSVGDCVGVVATGLSGGIGIAIVALADGGMEPTGDYIDFYGN